MRVEEWELAVTCPVSLPGGDHRLRHLVTVTNRGVTSRFTPCTAFSADATILGSVIGAGTPSWVSGDGLIDDSLSNLFIGWGILGQSDATA